MAQSVVLYRMILPDHTCPFGVRAAQMLDDAGVQFDDRILRSRQETDAFEEQHGVETTPQLFVDDERIGGSEELERWLGEPPAGIAYPYGVPGIDVTEETLAAAREAGHSFGVVNLPGAVVATTDRLALPRHAVADVGADDFDAWLRAPHRRPTAARAPS